MRLRRFAWAALCLFFTACGGQTQSAPQPTTTFDVRAVPQDRVGFMVRYGYELIVHTRAHLRSYVTADMDCAACHVNGGTKPRGGSFVGIAAQFPQWNARAKRVISLQDRLAECFLYSMNGHPPAYQSREMVAMVSYITYLSRGVKIGASPEPNARLERLQPSSPANAARGARLYAQKCALCHGADGGGSSAYPPLWGPRSFNGGAGMHRLGTMAGFVRYNMPQNAPGTLSDQQAYDVSAYVLAHARPKFDKRKAVVFPPQYAGYF